MLMKISLYDSNTTRYLLIWVAALIVYAKKCAMESMLSNFVDKHTISMKVNLFSIKKLQPQTHNLAAF